MSRSVSADTVFRVARTTLGRMACDQAAGAVANHPGHDRECLRDDEAYVADRLLRLISSIAVANDDAILHHLQVMAEMVSPAD